VRLTWGFGRAGRRFHIMMRPAGGVSEAPPVPEICISEVMSFFVL